jgi:hypothetical protein
MRCWACDAKGALVGRRFCGACRQPTSPLEVDVLHQSAVGVGGVLSVEFRVRSRPRWDWSASRVSVGQGANLLDRKKSDLLRDCGPVPSGESVRWLLNLVPTRPGSLGVDLTLEATDFRERAWRLGGQMSLSVLPKSRVKTVKIKQMSRVTADSPQTVYVNDASGGEGAAWRPLPLIPRGFSGARVGFTPATTAALQAAARHARELVRVLRTLPDAEHAGLPAVDATARTLCEIAGGLGPASPEGAGLPALADLVDQLAGLLEPASGTFPVFAYVSSQRVLNDVITGASPLSDLPDLWRLQAADQGGLAPSLLRFAADVLEGRPADPPSGEAGQESLLLGHALLLARSLRQALSHLDARRE